MNLLEGEIAANSLIHLSADILLKMLLNRYLQEYKLQEK